MNAPNDSPAPPSPPVKRLTFPRSRRMRSGLDFQRIYQLNQKSADANLVVLAATNTLNQTRIGLSVSRRHGNSVVRHRLRRMLREAYRLEQHHLPEGLDLVLIPGREAKAADITRIRDSLRRHVQRIVLRINQSGQI